MCYRKLHIDLLFVFKKENVLFNFIMNINLVFFFRFYSHLVEIFSERPKWDVEGKYSADTVNVYFELLNEYKSATKVTKIETQTCTLSDALSLSR